MTGSRSRPSDLTETHRFTLPDAGDADLGLPWSVLGWRGEDVVVLGLPSYGGDCRVGTLDLCDGRWRKLDVPTVGGQCGGTLVSAEGLSGAARKLAF